MTKKITAFLTAILCMASMTAMTAGAVEEIPTDDFIIYEGEDDQISAEYAFFSVGLYVKTNGKELTEEMVQPLFPIDDSVIDPLDPDKSPLDYAGNQVSVARWADVVSQNWGDYEVLIDLDENGYYIGCNAERTETLGRRLMLEYDFIEDVQIVTSKYVDPDVRVNIEFTMRPTFASEEIDPNALDIPELKDFYLDGKYYKMSFPEWDENGDYLEWFRNVTMPDFFNAFHEANPQYNDLRFEYIDGGMAGVRNVYDSYQSFKWLTDYCDAIVEKYPDVFTDLVPVPEESSKAVQCIDGTICWNEYVGDTNTDGEVDAADAADVLVIAAQNGTGAGIKATSANDVNADGYVDASDAAAVLSYAAAKGTGADVSWVDILRK